MSLCLVGILIGNKILHVRYRGIALVEALGTLRFPFQGPTTSVAVTDVMTTIHTKKRLKNYKNWVTNLLVIKAIFWVSCFPV